MIRVIINLNFWIVVRCCFVLLFLLFCNIFRVEIIVVNVDLNVKSVLVLLNYFVLYKDCSLVCFFICFCVIGLFFSVFCRERSFFVE